MKNRTCGNRTIIGIFCIILAVAVMFGISPIINRMAAGKSTVCQVNKVITQGTIITADDVIKVEIGTFGVADGLIKEETQLIGKYAKSDIYPNINIHPMMISGKADSAVDVFKSLNGSQLAISVTIPSLANGLSGKIQNGDIISIIVTGNGTESVIPPQLTYVKVITATTNKGSDSDNVNVKEDGTNDLPATITLLVNAEQAKLLAGYEQNYKIHIALVYRGTTENAARFLEAQEKIFTELSKSTTNESEDASNG